MSSVGLTRDEALNLIDEAGGDISELRALSIHWIGHDNAALDAEELAEVLADFVHECAFNGDDERSHGPKAGDSTGLTAP